MGEPADSRRGAGAARTDPPAAGQLGGGTARTDPPATGRPAVDPPTIWPATGQRYPGYNVLAKRNSPSWNEQTREVIDQRLAVAPDSHRFFSDDEWPTVCAICDRLIPQPADKPGRVPIAALLDQHLIHSPTEGYRDHRLPPMQEAWRNALDALDAESQQAHSRRFHELDSSQQDAMLSRVQNGDVRNPAWEKVPAKLFFADRLLHDVTRIYYAHPTAWSEIGFGGPAAPRGYVRMDFDRRDPWEASEARPGREKQARKDNARIR